MQLDEEYETEIEDLHKWFCSNPKLPNMIDRTLLRRFYQCVHYNMPETKKLIVRNYTLRNEHPEIFLQRDPLSETSLKTFAYADMIVLPRLTAEKYQIKCYRFIDNDPSLMNYTEDVKAFFMFMDCFLIMLDDEIENILSEGEIQIFDLAGCTMKHASKLKINTLRVYINFLQEAFPVHLKAVHLINCPPFLSKLIKFVQPFINKDVFKMIHSYSNGIENLYEVIPRDLFPEDYGGKCKKIKHLKTKTMKVLADKRNYLMDPNYWAIDKVK